MEQGKNNFFRYSFYYGFSLVGVIGAFIIFLLWGSLYSTLKKNKESFHSQNVESTSIIDTVYLPAPECTRTHCDDHKIKDSSEAKKKYKDQ